MEAIKNKKNYPYKAKATYIGDSNRSYEHNIDYLIDVYKKGDSKSVFVCISGNPDTETEFYKDKDLPHRFRIIEYIKSEKNQFVLTISKSGVASVQSSNGASIDTIIATLEIVKQSYVINQLNGANKK